MSTRTLGLIVNPVAGLGGAVGLKGTDEGVTQALRLGAQPQAPERARRALEELKSMAGRLNLLCPRGAMGEDIALAAGFRPMTLDIPIHPQTSAADTRQAAQALAASGVDLLLFVGGDGTARDVLQAVGERVPVLGIPAGVKMHSAVFAITPRHAGELAARFLRADPMVRLEPAEVMDRDPAPGAPVSPELYGFLRVPQAPYCIQQAKAVSRVGDEARLQGACLRLAQAAREQALTIIGPGTTTRRIKQALGFEGTLDGVDLATHGRLFAQDCSEARILEALNERPAHIIVGIVGGQGFLFGRGNQPISAWVIRRVGRENISIVASREKLAALPQQRLFVDTGDPEVDAMLSGFMRVQVGAREQMLMRVGG